jgi:integrase
VTKILTQIAAQNAKPKRNAGGNLVRTEYPDGASGGLLYLVVQPSGAKSLALRFRFDGISEKVTLGRLAERPGDGGVTLAEGRKAAAEARQKIEQGINPAGTRRAERAEAKRAASLREADSIERLAEQFIELHAKRKTRPRSVENTERALRLILAAWRGRSVHDIRRRDVIELLDQIVADRTDNVADKTHQVGSRFFSWLVARDVISSSPWVGIERPARYSARERTLTDDEVRRLWLACEAEGPEGQAIRLMLLTGCRRNEVFELPRSELDQGQGLWMLPGATAKNGKTHVMPLPPLAWSVLDSVPQFAASDLVFTPDGRRFFGGYSRLKDALSGRADLKSWRFHDLRRTCASGMQKVGVRTEIIEKCLNHVSGAFRGIVGVYQRHDFLAEKEDAFRRWADHIEQIVTGKPATVVPMRRGG